MDANRIYSVGTRVVSRVPVRDAGGAMYTISGQKVMGV